MLYKDGEMARTLDIETLEEYSRNGKLIGPWSRSKRSMTEVKEIFCPKALRTPNYLVIVQCLARGVAKITLTQKELATLAFSVLNIILCILWWNNLGVAYPFQFIIVVLYTHQL